MTTFNFDGCTFVFNPEIDKRGQAGVYLPDEKAVHYNLHEQWWLEHLAVLMGLGYNLHNMHIILHEYVHYLQHKKGGFKEMVLLGVNAPITEPIKLNYPEHKWVIEAEAVWLQNKWYKFMTEEKLWQLDDLILEANS